VQALHHQSPAHPLQGLAAAVVLYSRAEPPDLVVLVAGVLVVAALQALQALQTLAVVAVVADLPAQIQTAALAVPASSS
jgi:hypothetical protein